MFNTSYIEISRSAYRNNLRYLKKLVGKNVLISSVIKGNAYGHGIKHIVPLAEESGIRHFSVFSAGEAKEVLQVKSPNTQLMIMGHLDRDELDWAVENELSFFVFDLDRLRDSLAAARKIGKPAHLHLEVETGFHRTGLEYDRMNEVCGLLRDNKEHMIFEGLCTHYAGAESLSNFLRVKNQLSAFRKFYRYFSRKGILPLRRHTACSAAALTYPATIMDMVRIGIAQFGFWPSPETRMFRFKRDLSGADNHLKRMLSWKTHVMAIKEVDAGQFIGYGSSYLANKKTRIAVIPVGYANGFSRSLSNTGRVLIRGRRVPVVGTVTMNTMTVNVSDLPSIEVGDEVVIIGRQKRMDISISSFCDMSNLLNYQLLTRIPADIPRIIVK
jgi:alanine racemase